MKLVICHRDRYPSFMDAVRLVVVALPATDITHEGFTANWTKNNVATGYLLDVATDSDFENIIINALAAGNVTSRIITGLDPGTDYYYRVTALDGPGTGHYSNVIEVTTETVALGYGLLYNWYAVDDARKITSSDSWVIPVNNDGGTWDDFETLNFYLDNSEETSGGILKDLNSDYWDSPNTGATNAVGFNGRGNGMRNSDGSFMLLKQWGTFWVRELFGGGPGNCLLKHDSALTFTTGFNTNHGMGIRIVREATVDEQLLSDGTICDPYTGNDGKVYRTVKIGTQVWLADNLAETKYRDGSDIPIVTDNAAWAALTDGAMCAYDNDWGNV